MNWYFIAIFFFYVSAQNFSFSVANVQKQHFNMSENNVELVAVAVIFRHGDRSPFLSFPSDQYFNEIYWPMGLGGELTKYGINRHYKLGQWLRQRYNNFISELYSVKEFYAYSSGSNRCLMSATANLAGLYPPKDNQMWNDKILWQPIPVHSNEPSSEKIFIHELPCPKFNKLFKPIKTNKYNMLKNRYQSFFELIANKTGWKEMDLDKIATVRSVFYAYRNYNVSYLPKWINEVDQHILDELSAIKYAVPSSTPSLTRLQIGPFFDYIFKYFNNFLKPSSDKRSHKFLMLSSTDANLVHILNGIGCFNNIPVGFGDTMIWELKKKGGEYFINLLMKIEDKLEQLDCCIDCHYETFRKQFANVTVDIDNWKQECFSV